MTYLLQGSFQHLDSYGHKGTIKAGGVQWMTAGSGLVHSEMPSDEIMQQGGILEGFQLWVNLPKSHKMTPPRYQELDPEQIPTANIIEGQGRIKVISGEALGVKAKIDTIIPIIFLDILLSSPMSHVTQVIPLHYNSFIYIIKGDGIIGNNNIRVSSGQVAIIDTDTDNGNDNNSINISTGPNDNLLHILLLAGRPLNEPIARYGPFVMNTQDEIEQAFEDYQQGKMGTLVGSEERNRITQQAKRTKQQRLYRGQQGKNEL